MMPRPCAAARGAAVMEDESEGATAHLPAREGRILFGNGRVAEPGCQRWAASEAVAPTTVNVQPASRTTQTRTVWRPGWCE
jgi:hypothetical protein